MFARRSTSPFGWSSLSVDIFYRPFVRPLIGGRVISSPSTDKYSDQLYSSAMDGLLVQLSLFFHFSSSDYIILFNQLLFCLKNHGSSVIAESLQHCQPHLRSSHRLFSGTDNLVSLEQVSISLRSLYPLLSYLEQVYLSLLSGTSMLFSLEQVFSPNWNKYALLSYLELVSFLIGSASPSSHRL